MASLGYLFGNYFIYKTCLPKAIYDTSCCTYTAIKPKMGIKEFETFTGDMQAEKPVEC